MKTFAVIAGLLAGLCIVAPGQAYGIGLPAEARQDQEVARLTTQLYQARLGQIALLIEHHSRGESRLLIGQGVSGKPSVAALRRRAPEQTPLITVYPASRPVTAELGYAGECELLGAVALGAPATGPWGPGGGELRVDLEQAAALPDVYLLAYAKNGAEPGEVRLVSPTVDEQGRTLSPWPVSALAQRSKSHSGVDRPVTSVRFPGKDEIADDNPAHRAHVRIAWRDFVYEFPLDLEIPTQ